MLRAVLFEGIDDFAQLESAWNDLARSVDGVRFTQTFEWARLGWAVKTPLRGDMILCATVWSGDRLIAVWPFQRTRLGFSSRLEPLGCGMHEEYGDPLMAPDVDQARVCSELLQLLVPRADLIEIPFVKIGAPMQVALAQAGILNVVQPFDAYVVERKGFEGFEALMRGYSGNFRAKLKQNRKRLQSLGDVSFECPQDSRTCKETVEWVLAEKRRWLLQHNKKSKWLQKIEASLFFSQISTEDTEFGRVGIFRLMLSGKIVAAFVTTVDRTRVEGMIMSFDPEHARSSPGMLLMENVTRWCFERNLDFDMRPLHMDYKERWGNSTSAQLKYRTSLTWRGTASLLPDYLLHALRSLLRSTLSLEQRDAIRRMLNWRHKLKMRDDGAVGRAGNRATGKE
ncbi:GNAT family N-acetyltransferase [Neorhizobium sp. JUb45]|uniref:GNAT family N-acetyltransferase n=1 Tax=unclassified Neorhizobium TaxID=2629175 RepID=UPI0010466D6F|nr:GNAT family N-acetyltransferase [Neorhizobium sp. JUb45]TCQ99964.1 CelD/BcsL family acetyltransferase involved in cellulose biosynthesis [Neorhizobium sp. JUb45]